MKDDWRRKDTFLARIYYWLINAHIITIRGKRIFGLVYWWGTSVKWKTLSFYPATKFGHNDYHGLWIGKFELRFYTNKFKEFRAEMERDYLERKARGFK